MAVSIANIAIKLGLSSEAVRAGLKESEDAVRNFHDRVKSSTAVGNESAGSAATKGIDLKLMQGLESFAKNAIGKMLTLAGAVTTANMSLSAMHTQMQAMDKTGKLADSLGTTTEALQRLRFAGDLAGQGAATIDTALKVLQKNLGQIRDGGGESAARALEELGLSANRLAFLDPAAAFGELAEAISKLPTPADRAAAAIALFGKQGQDVLSVLSLGKKGLDEMAKEADRLGVSFSRVDAAKIEEANDAVTRLETAFGALIQATAVALTPAMVKLADTTTEVASALMSIDEALGGNTIRVAAFAGGVVTAIGIINKLIPALTAATNAIRAQGVAQAFLNAMLGPTGWIKLAGGVLIAGAAMWAADRATESLNNRVKDAGKQASAFNAETDATAAHLNKLKSAMEGHVAALRGTGQVDLSGLRSTQKELDRLEGKIVSVAKNGKTIDLKTEYGNSHITELDGGKFKVTFDQDATLKDLDKLAALTRAHVQRMESPQMTRTQELRIAEEQIDRLNAKLAKASGIAKTIDLKTEFGNAHIDDLGEGKFKVRIDDDGSLKDFDKLMKLAQDQVRRLKAGVQVMDAEQLEKATQKMDELRRKSEDWLRIGKNLTNEVATPLEQAKAKLAEVDAALGAGAISWEIYERHVQKVADELSKATDKANKLRNAQKVEVGAVTRHSVAGFSAVQSGRAEMQRLEQEAREHTKEQKRTNELLAQIDTSVRGNKVTVKKVKLG